MGACVFFFMLFQWKHLEMNWEFEDSGKENELPVLKAAKMSSREHYATACEALLGDRETEEHRGQCY